MDDVNMTCEGIQFPDFTDFRILLQAIALTLLSIAVILGNCLVIIAVFTTQRLRTVTNMFIASLAFADLTLGVAVLPFSSTKQLLSSWPFGSIWCSMWLAIDVWMCTASILNLVAISFDRFLAISKPFKYHSLLTPRRGKLLIGGVWALSFIICLPPLIGWNDEGKFISERFSTDCDKSLPTLYNATVSKGNEGNIEFEFSGDSDWSMYKGNYSITETNGSDIKCCTEAAMCDLTSDPGYVVYSAMGSFYIPMVIMVCFYWQIYRTAIKASNVLKRGVLTTRTGGDILPSCSDNAVTLRVHRGGKQTTKLGHSFKSHESSKLHGDQTWDLNPSRRGTMTPDSDIHGSSHPLAAAIENGRGSPQPSDSESHRGCVMWEAEIDKSRKSCCQLQYFSNSPIRGRNRKYEKQMGNGSASHSPSESRDMLSPGQRARSGSDRVAPAVMFFKQGRKNIHSQLKKLSRETKAAKTVGIIVGCFILCWLPFFTVYIIGAFHENFTAPIVFSIFFWLGYCNSALNPCIYAMFSRDFRFAFKRILFCGKQKRHFDGRSRSRTFTCDSTLYLSNKESESTSDIGKRLMLEDTATSDNHVYSL